MQGAPVASGVANSMRSKFVEDVMHLWLVVGVDICWLLMLADHCGTVGVPIAVVVSGSCMIVTGCIQMWSCDEALGDTR